MKIDNNKLSREELIEKEKAVVAGYAAMTNLPITSFMRNVVLCSVRFFGRYSAIILITMNL